MQSSCFHSGLHAEKLNVGQLSSEKSMPRSIYREASAGLGDSARVLGKEPQGLQASTRLI